jgi:hypothetical protein
MVAAFTREPLTDAEMERWERMGYFNYASDDTLIACDRSYNYGYCHDRGCVARGCWIARSEGGVNPKADRYVINAGDTPDDLPAALKRSERKWENVKHANAETLSEAMTEMDEAMRRLRHAITGTTD